MILVVNAGSTSAKIALFDGGSEVLRGEVSGVGGAGRLRLGPRDEPARAPDHAGAMTLLLAALAEAGHPPEALTAAAHRVVHGGARLTAPARLTPAVVSEIEALCRLAPLHNPANLAGIRALDPLGIPQVASFDTAFHATIPEVESTYAIPREWRDRGFRRYGFHGISYAHLTDSLRRRGLLPRRLLAFHLGGGCSACAILDGASVATTMGYSPLDGLVMGTRAGGLDGMAVLEIARAVGVDEAARLLNRDSGLLALAGTADMRALLARGDPAIRTFVHWAARHGGALAAAMGGVDALAFTGGIGENAPEVREAIAARLAFLGPLPLHVVAAEEEARIARDALAILDQQGRL